FENDKILSGDKLQLSGSGGAGDVVVFSLVDADGKEVSKQTITIPASGLWELEFAGLVDGKYQILAHVTDDAGNSLDRIMDKIVIDNSNDLFTSELEDYQGVTGDNITSDTKPNFQGQGEPGAEITLTINGKTYTTQVSSSGSWYFEWPEVLGDGDYVLKSFSTDAAGNKTATTEINFTVDSTLPVFNYEIEGITEAGGNRYINSKQGDVIFTGTASEPGTIILQINNQEFTKEVDSTGNWSFDLGKLIDQKYQYTLIFKDIAGNTVKQTGEVIVDCTIKIEIRLTGETNSSAPGYNIVDKITKEKKVAFEFRDASTIGDKDLIASVTVTGPNGFSHTYTGIPTNKNWWLPDELDQDGTYTFKWHFVDPAGNEASLSNSIILDTYIAPITAGNLFFNGEPFSDSGSIYVKDSLIGFDYRHTGSDNLYKVDLKLNGLTYTANNFSGVMRFLGVTLAEGANNILLIAYDTAGNSSKFEYTIIYKSGFDVFDFNIEGEEILDFANIETVNSNNPDRTIAISGHADIGSKFAIKVNGLTVATSQVEEDGSWKYDLELSEGNNRIVIVFEDIAGNEKTLNFNTVIDTVAPILTIDEVSGENYQIIENEHVITGDEVKLSGRIDYGSTITSITVNGEEITLPENISNGGIWSITIADLLEGKNSIVIKSQDVAGNESQSVVNITRDSTPPVLTFEGALDENGDPILSEDLKDNTPTLSGTASEQAKISVVISSQDGLTSYTYSATADKNGQWTVSITPALADGDYRVQIVATDAAGNHSQLESSFTIDTAPPALTFTGIVDENGAPDLSDIITNATPTFAGTASEQAKITLQLTLDGGAVFNYSAAADADGKWSLEISPALADGHYTVKIIATDAAGNSTQLESSFTLDVTPPELIFAGIVDENGAPESSELINDNRPNFVGTASEQARITLQITQQDGSTLRFSSVADEDGNWSVPVTPALADGYYTVQIVATDAAGNSSQAIQTSFTVDTTPPALSFTGIEDENGAPDLFG
ncbi:MAG: Ig-like domain-containing protein, partial [Enterovibrio sp.]